MEIYTYSVELSLTHVEKSNTRDSYILIKQPMGNNSKFTLPLFDNKDFDQLEIHDLFSGEKYLVRAAYKYKNGYNAEFRVTQMASYMEKNELDSGDIIHLQRVKFNDQESRYYIWYTKFNGVVLHREDSFLYRANSDYKINKFLDSGIVLIKGEEELSLTFKKEGELNLTKPHKDQPFPLYAFLNDRNENVFNEKTIYLKHIKENVFKLIPSYSLKFLELKVIDNVE